MNENRKFDKQISNAVIRRLPRYFRYLRELMAAGIDRISSKELAKRMKITASQIRQDLNCFGGFGQQGYGYNVRSLYAEICDILGVNEGYRAIIVGVGNLGTALAGNPLFAKRGVEIIGLFDNDSQKIGKKICNMEIMDIGSLEGFLAKNKVDIAVLTVPKLAAKEVASLLAGFGITGFWNFSNAELHFDDENIKIENIHLGDTLMTLCYELSLRNNSTNENESGE